MMFWLALACHQPDPEKTATPTPGPDTGPELTLQGGVLSGSVPNSGYGRSLAFDGTTLYVGAPYENRVGAVYAGEERLFVGREAERMGIGLASGNGPLLIGSVGRILDPNQTSIAEKTGIGGVIATYSGGWAASIPEGVYRSDGTTLTLGQQPSALAFLGEELAIGFTRGPIALRLGDKEIGREQVGLGFSLTVGDVDGDDVEDLVVGSPVAGEVVVYDANLSEKGRITLGESRFGSAVVVPEPGVLLIGAPLHGTLAQGAIYRVLWGKSPEQIAEGAAEDDQLGTALTGGKGWWAAGALGAATAPGSVRIEVE